MRLDLLLLLLTINLWPPATSVQIIGSMNTDDYEDSLELQHDENKQSLLTSSLQSSVSVNIHQDEFDGSPHLWSKSDFNKKYVLRSSNVLGTGASSKVYLGSDIVKSVDVAIKVVDRSTLCQEEEERLVAEIEILRELSHKYILCELI